MINAATINNTSITITKNRTVDIPNKNIIRLFYIGHGRVGTLWSTIPDQLASQFGHQAPNFLLDKT